MLDFKNYEETNLKGVYKIKIEKFTDDRGYILNLFENKKTHFYQDKLTVSKKNVLRGLHCDSINDKLIFCIKGKFKLVVVNYDINHEQYLQKIHFDMEEKSDYAVFVPRNFLNGHYCLEDNTFFYYKWSSGYITPEKQITISWNSPSLSIDWGLIEKNPHLSERDKCATLI